MAASSPTTTTESGRLRDRVLPRTALGLSVLFLFTSIGAAFSGAVLFAYYQFRLDQNEDSITSLVDEFDQRVDEATEDITKSGDDAAELIKREMEPLQKIAASGETLADLVEQVAPSVWFVSTLDDAGQPSVGSAFVVASDNEQTFLLTSYTTVAAATRSPAPGIAVRQGNDEISATLWTWEEARDLALLVIGRGGQPRLDWSRGSIDLGDRVFVVSGLGSAGAAITQGGVADVSASGFQHDAAVGAAYQGGPIVTGQGEVIGVASRTYSPLRFAPLSVTFGVPIRDACINVLRCPDNNATASGGGTRR